MKCMLPDGHIVTEHLQALETNDFKRVHCERFKHSRMKSILSMGYMVPGHA